MSKKEQVIQELNRVISLIHTDIQAISPAEKKQMVEETVEHYNHYVSPGWLAYRKSVSSDSEAGAVLEWQDEGAYCYGLNGEQFIDCLGGFGIYTCGHRNPEILDVVKAQLDHQALHSQELLDPLRGYLAKAMADITPGELQYCFFTNGGAEAVEMALKLARIATGGRWYISTVGAFHGKSMGAVSMGGKGTYRTPYTPMIQQVQHVEYGVAEDIRKAIRNLQAVGEKVAAVILEPIQGEAGIIVPPEGYLQEVREICDETGVVLIFDEIPTAFGRTGTMFAFENYDIEPDILVTGKGLGGSLYPISAIIAKESLDVCQDISLGHYTHEKSPLGCAVGLALLEYIEQEHLLEHVADLNALMERRAEKMKASLPAVGDVRLIGALLGIELVRDRETKEKAVDEAEKILYRCLEQGLSFKISQGNVLTLAPPLIISEAELSRALDIVEEAIRSLT